MSKALRFEPYGPHQWNITFRWLDEEGEDAEEQTMLVFTKEQSLVDAYAEAEYSLDSGGRHLILGIDYVGERK